MEGDLFKKDALDFMRDGSCPRVLIAHADRLQRADSVWDTHRAAMKLAFAVVQCLSQLATAAYLRGVHAVGVESIVTEVRGKTAKGPEPSMGDWEVLLRELAKAPGNPCFEDLFLRDYALKADLPKLAVFVRGWNAIYKAHQGTVGRAGQPPTGQEIVGLAEQAISTGPVPQKTSLALGMLAMVQFRNMVAHALENDFPDDEDLLSWMNDRMGPALMEFVRAASVWRVLCGHSVFKVVEAKYDRERGFTGWGRPHPQTLGDGKFAVTSSEPLNQGSTYLARLTTAEPATVLFELRFDLSRWPECRTTTETATLDGGTEVPTEAQAMGRRASTPPLMDAGPTAGAGGDSPRPSPRSAPTAVPPVASLQRTPAEVSSAAGAASDPTSVPDQSPTIIQVLGRAGEPDRGQGSSAAPSGPFPDPTESPFYWDWVDAMGEHIDAADGAFY